MDADYVPFTHRAENPSAALAALPYFHNETQDDDT